MIKRGGKGPVEQGDGLLLTPFELTHKFVFLQMSSLWFIRHWSGYMYMYIYVCTSTQSYIWKDFFSFVKLSLFPFFFFETASTSTCTSELKPKCGDCTKQLCCVYFCESGF